MIERAGDEARSASPTPAPTPDAGRAGPFDPPGIEWQRVSPRLVAVRLISLAIGLVIPLGVTVAIAVIGAWTWLWVLPGVVVALAVWAALLVPRQVRAIGYAEREDDLLVRRGILFRSLVVVPYGRMQFVDVQAGPLDRWGGIATVQLHTASPGSDAVIPGLVPDEAARLRDRLAARGEAQLAGL
jgi:uncharacterized protein